MTLHYYIYYRVPPENAGRARVAIAGLQEDLAARTGVAGKFLRRRDDETTWMEIYENVPDAQQLEAVLADLVRERGIAVLLVPGTTRKQEVFRSF